MRKLVPLLVVVMLMAVACGGDDETGDSTTTSSGPTSTVARTSATSSPSASDGTISTISVPSTADVEPPAAETTEPTTAETVPVTEIDAVVTLRAVGPIRIGMTVEEASVAAGVTLRQDFGRQATSGCRYVTPAAALRGVSIMVVDDRIARIEIDPPSDVETRSGVRIGTSASDLRDVYPNNIRTANDAVLDGQAMAFVPNDDADAGYRIYFEIEDGQVARYRVGVKPAIDYLRGCPEE